MKIEPLGDSAFIVRELDETAFALASALNAAPPRGLIEAVASYDTVGLYVDPDRFDVSSITEATVSRLAQGKLHQVPVCYEAGPDLSEAAKALGIGREELIAIHLSRAYRCFAVGFCPGFPYLGYLDDRISGLRRRATPRVRVEPGSVAMTGRQTGIYPLPRPGGWWLIGRTPCTLVDVEEGYFPIEAGDEVQFVRIGADELAARQGERL